MTLVEPKEIDHCRFPIPKNGREFEILKLEQLNRLVPF